MSFKSLYIESEDDSLVINLSDSALILADDKLIITDYEFHESKYAIPIDKLKYVSLVNDD